MQNCIVYKARAIIAVDQHLLLVRTQQSRNVWTFVGGELKHDEPFEEGLARKVAEKLGTEGEIGAFFREAQYPEKRRIVLMRSYFVHVNPHAVRPSKEIVETYFFAYDRLPLTSLAGASAEIIRELRAEGYLGNKHGLAPEREDAAYEETVHEPFKRMYPVSDSCLTSLKGF